MYLVFFTAALFIIFIAESFLIYRLYKKDRMDTLGQLQVVYLLFSVFYISALISPLTDKQYLYWIISEGILILVPFLAITIIRIAKRGHSCSLKGFFRTHGWELAIVGFILLTRGWMLTANQKWDSSEYFYAIDKACKYFDFSPSSVLEHFALLSHPSYAFAFAMAPGRFLFTHSVTGMLLVNLIATVFAAVLIYRLLCGGLTHMSKARAFTGTLICFLVPIVWGGFACVMVDYLLALFFVFFVYCEQKQKHVLTLFWGIMIIFSKEVGCVILFGYYFFKLIAQMIGMKNVPVRKRLGTALKHPSIIVGMICGGVEVVFILLNKGVSNWKHSVYYADPMSWSGDATFKYNSFGIEWDNIFTRLKQYFFVNFNWVILLFLVIGIIVYVVKRVRKKKTKVHIMRLLPLIGGMSAYALLMCLYITACSLRYNVLFSIGFVMIAYIFVADMFKNAGTIGIVSASFILMFAAQSFMPVDPVSNAMFTVRNIDDNHKILCVSQKEIEAPGGDYYLTNLQYLWVDKAFDKLLKTVDYTRDDFIMIADNDPAACIENATLSEWAGRRSDKRWDPAGKKYINTVDEENLVPNRLTSNMLYGYDFPPSKDVPSESNQALSALEKVNGRVIFYYSPLFQRSSEKEILDRLGTYFSIEKQDKVTVAGMDLKYCILKKKDIAYDVFAQDGLTDEERTQRELQNTAVDITEAPDRTTVKTGDTVTVSIGNYIDDAFVYLPYSPKGMVQREMTIGTGEYVDDVDTKLTGKKIGDVVRVTVTFPKDYKNEKKFAGKKVTMSIQILSINRELPSDD